MSTIAETTVSPRVITELAATYEFAHPDIVHMFIASHPDLAPLLQDAREHIRDAFGQETRTALEVICDPDEDGPGTLYAFIQTTLDPEEALNRLDRLSDGWWRSTIGAEPVPLHFTIEYV